MPYMYILMCNDGTYYTGSTRELAHRVELHNAGRGANYTKDRLPVELVYYEQFKYMWDAFRREKQIQGWSHDKKKALIERDILYLKVLSIGYSERQVK